MKSNSTPEVLFLVAFIGLVGTAVSVYLRNKEEQQEQFHAMINPPAAKIVTEPLEAPQDSHPVCRPADGGPQKPLPMLPGETALPLHVEAASPSSVDYSGFECPDYARMRDGFASALEPGVIIVTMNGCRWCEREMADLRKAGMPFLEVRRERFPRTSAALSSGPYPTTILVQADVSLTRKGYLSPAQVRELSAAIKSQIAKRKGGA